MRSDWERVKQYSTENESIVFIRDLNLGRMSVTNDAESVFADCQALYGPCRVVYEDSQGDMTEIVGTRHDPSRWNIDFRPWHGIVWDILQSN